MNFTIVVTSIAVNDFDYVLIFEDFGGFILNLFLVILMLRTRRKEIEKAKPIYFDPTILIVEENNDSS